MNSYKDLARNEIEELMPLAEAALARYGLDGALIQPDDQDGRVIFHLVMPADACAVHPYLGRLAGKRFLLQVYDSGEHSVAVIQQDLVQMAALLRDTDLDLPEPVPACDGSLVVEMPGRDEACYCVLFRWAWRSGLEAEILGWHESFALQAADSTYN